MDDASRPLRLRSSQQAKYARRVVVVAPYDEEWPRWFEGECVLLERLLEPWLEGGIHHIGSTAIPGIAAKAIIDMMAGVRDLEEARAAFEPLARASYIHAPHRPGIAHHFVKPSLDLGAMTHGLHLTEPGSDLWLERLAFRDILCANATLRSEYTSLKLRLAAEHPENVQAYTEGKRAFVTRVLALAGLQPGPR